MSEKWRSLVIDLVIPPAGSFCVLVFSLHSFFFPFHYYKAVELIGGLVTNIYNGRDT